MLRRVGVLLVAVVLAAGCQTASEPAAPPDTAPGDSARDGAAGPSAADRAATLDSLRRVDDHPLWTMRYRGEYSRFARVSEQEPRPRFGCSLFTAHGDRANPLFARNFDFPRQPALLLFTSPPDGYSSVSVVDTSYLGLTSDADFRTEAGRRALLDAPLLPFDGMNSAGLAVGLATVPGSGTDERAELPEVGSVRVQRFVLDEAATVDEAVAVFERYRVDFTGGPTLHYLIADARGDTAVVEFVDGELVVDRQRAPWRVMVNFPLTGADQDTLDADTRYRTASDALRAADGTLAPTGAMELLSDVRQHHTQWSVVYGQRTGEVRLATGRDYDTVHRFTLDMT